MERLTKKYIDYGEVAYQSVCGLNEFEFGGGREQTFTKLGQLEDIEEELEIDLVTLFKALKNGVYWKGNCIFSPKSNGVYFEDKPKLDIENKLLRNILYQVNKDYVYLKDYGKTWALTKEELENHGKR